jgi:hypothetical protein
MRKRSRLHCSHASHTVKCDCHHMHFQHADIPEEGRLEAGHCLEPRCRCESFKALPSYRPDQLIHETVPIEGYMQRTKSGSIVSK